MTGRDTQEVSGRTNGKGAEWNRMRGTRGGATGHRAQAGSARGRGGEGWAVPASWGAVSAWMTQRCPTSRQSPADYAFWSQTTGWGRGSAGTSNVSSLELSFLVWQIECGFLTARRAVSESWIRRCVHPGTLLTAGPGASSVLGLHLSPHQVSLCPPASAVLRSPRFALVP